MYPYYKNLSTADRENQLSEISRNDLYKLYGLRSVQKLFLKLSFKEPVDTYKPDLKKTTTEVATSLFVRVSDFRCVPYQFTGQTAVCLCQPSYITTETGNVPVKSRGGFPGLQGLAGKLLLQPLRTVRPIYRTGVPLPTRCFILCIFFQQI